MTKVFLDCCTLMSYFTGREDCDAVEAILSLAEKKKMVCFTSGNIIYTLSYLFEKYKVMPKNEIPEAISSVLEIVNVLPTGREEIVWAVEHSSGDFEDAVQCASANGRCDIIVTSDKKHGFDNAVCPVHTPGQFLASFSAAQSPD